MSDCDCESCEALRRECGGDAADYMENLRTERDAAIAKAETLDENLATAIESLRIAERARDELGIQLAAQSERLRLAMAVGDVARVVADHAGPNPARVGLASLRVALRALDAVPGDALAPK